MKRIAWTFPAMMVAFGLASPAMAQHPKQGMTATPSARPSHLPKLHKSAKHVPAKPAATAPKR